MESIFFQGYLALNTAKEIQTSNIECGCAHTPQASLSEPLQGTYKRNIALALNFYQCEMSQFLHMLGKSNFTLTV